MYNDLIIVDQSNNQLADIQTTSAKITRKINAEFCLDFECFEQELKTEYITTDNSVIADNQIFDILYFEQNHVNNKISYRVQANHVFYRLIQKKYDYYTYDGTPSEILADILADTDFSVGQVDASEIMTFAVAEQTTAAQLIIDLCATLNLELNFRNKGFTIDLLDTIGADNGFEIRFGKNLKGIRTICDKRSGTEVKSYQVDILELKNSTEYIEKGLQDLEVIGIGDTVYVVDEKTGLDIENRIVSVSYDPRFRKNTSVEIATAIQLFTDAVTKIQRDTVAKGKLYNGIRISPDNGFEAIRSDELVRVSMNATNGIQIDVKNADGGYTPAFFVQVDGQQAKLYMAGNAVYEGSITADQISTSIPDSKISSATNWNSKINETDAVRIIGNTVNAPYINALNIQAASVKSDWVYAGDINANQIKSGSISADIIDGGTLSGCTIAVQTNALVGNNLYIGASTSGTRNLVFKDQSGNEIGLITAGGNNIVFTYGSSDKMYINQNEVDIPNLKVQTINISSPLGMMDGERLATQPWVLQNSSFEISPTAPSDLTKIWIDTSGI